MPLSSTKNTQNPTSTKTRIKTLAKTSRLRFSRKSQNPTSTKTRIKTPPLQDYNSSMTLLRTQLPLKQGLRPPTVVPLSSTINTQNPTSTKTRIKTLRFSVLIENMDTQNPTSTKTRIKTANGCAIVVNHKPQNPTSTKTRIKTDTAKDYLYSLPILRTQLPLKQGLRRPK